MTVILDQYGRPMRPQAGGYDGALRTRARNRGSYWRSYPSSEDKLLGRMDRSRLVQECYDLRRNNAVVAAACDRFADHVVGPDGLRPQAKTADEDWNAQAEQYWHEWGKIADLRGRLNMRGMQRLAVSARLLAGEMYYVLVSNGQILPVEPDRIETPTTVPEEPGRVLEGIRLSPQGRKLAYYVCDRKDGGAVDRTAARVVLAADMVHAAAPAWRADVVRPAPELSPVINLVSDYADLQEAMLAKARAEAKNAYAVSTQEGSGLLDNLGPRDATPAGTNQKYESIENAQVYYLQPGEDVRSLGLEAPGGDFVPYAELLLQHIAAALNLPYEFFMMRFDSSFSASRAALQSTYRTFNMWQTWLIDALLQRAWNWRIAKAIREGDLPPAPVDGRGFSTWYKVEWSRPDYDWIDPKAEVMGQQREWALGTGTISMFARRRGRDGLDVMQEKAGDIKMAIMVADQLQKETGKPVTWYDIIGGFGMGTGGNVAFGGGESENDGSVDE